MARWSGHKTKPPYLPINSSHSQKDQPTEISMMSTFSFNNCLISTNTSSQKRLDLISVLCILSSSKNFNHYPKPIRSSMDYEKYSILHKNNESKSILCQISYLSWLWSCSLWDRFWSLSCVIGNQKLIFIFVIIFIMRWIMGKSYFSTLIVLVLSLICIVFFQNNNFTNYWYGWYFSVINLYMFHYIRFILFFIITIVSAVLLFLYASFYIIKKQRQKIIFSTIGILSISYLSFFSLSEFQKNITIMEYNWPCQIVKEIKINENGTSWISWLWRIIKGMFPKTYLQYNINNIPVREWIISDISKNSITSSNIECIWENISFKYSKWNGVYRDTIKFK